MMAEKNMTICYLSRAISTGMYIINRTLIATIVHDVTLEERLFYRKLNVLHMKVFGCIAYLHVLDELRKKLDPKAKKCVFNG